MSHPLVHARSSVRRFGGVPEDFLPIHDLLDSSKAVFPDNRHRALTHNSWFFFIVEKIFGHEIDLTCRRCNGTGQSEKDAIMTYDDDGTSWCDTDCTQCKATGKSGHAKTRYVCEQHVLEDYGNKFIPTPADYLEGMEFQEWMNNGIKGAPTSHRKIEEKEVTVKTTHFTFDRPMHVLD